MSTSHLVLFGATAATWVEPLWLVAAGLVIGVIVVSSVALVVSSAAPQAAATMVPTFQGLEIAAARLLADQVGLALNESTEVGPDPPGTVVSQAPAPGTAVALGASVDVIVSSGPAAAP